jgi:hypothetical protein
MKLILVVVEFEPFAFQTVENEIPTNYANKYSQGWDDYLSSGALTISSSN